MTDQLAQDNTVGVVIPNLSVIIDACLATSIGMFLRFRKDNINMETKTAGKLDQSFEMILGAVVCERATPFPCRT